MIPVRQTNLRVPVRAFVALTLLVSVLAGCQAEAPETEDRLWSPPALTDQSEDLPVGREVVQRVVEFMQAHDQVTFEALATYEVVQDDGQKLQFDMLHRVAIHRPDKIHWETLNDDASVETAWFDAGTFILLKQPANLWGRIILPPTISDALDRLDNEYNVAVPFLDLISGDVAELWLGEEVESISWVGESWIDGRWTDHVAIRKPGVDIELWFRKGEEPYPVKFVVVRTQEPGLPCYSARFREWAIVLPEGAIPTFVPPEDSEQVEVVPSSGD